MNSEDYTSDFVTKRKTAESSMANVPVLRELYTGDFTDEEVVSGYESLYEGIREVAESAGHQVEQSLFAGEEMPYSRDALDEVCESEEYELEDIAFRIDIGDDVLVEVSYRPEHAVGFGPVTEMRSGYLEAEVLFADDVSQDERSLYESVLARRGFFEDMYR